MIIQYCYGNPAKERKASKLKAQLRKVAEALGLPKGSYDLRFNRGGIAVWGEVTLHTETHYIQANAGCDLGILVRTCHGRRDYSGGRNHWVPEALLANPEAFAARVKEIR